MTDSPKLRPYAVAMLFGQGGNVNLGLGIVGASDREHAGAHAVLIHAREHNVTEPLIAITIMEIEDRVVRLMFNGLKPGEVVPMRVVEGEPATVRLETGEVIANPYVERQQTAQNATNPQSGEPLGKLWPKGEDDWHERFPPPPRWEKPPEDGA